MYQSSSARRSEFRDIPLGRAVRIGNSLIAVSMAGAALLASHAAFAQPEGDAIEEVTINGSRIQRDGYSAPTPVSVLNSDEIDAVAPANITDFVSTLPSIQGTATASSNSGSLSNGQAGIASLNLRSLGANRTLVLLDGQRSVTSATTGLIDINTFPQSLISRVEVVTGGASAAYGSDAVGGVVNFVLDRNYVGFKTNYQYGETTYGDLPNHKFTLTAGSGFAGDRGHALFSAEVFDQKGKHVNDRDWNDAGYFQMQNPLWSAALNGINGEPERYVGAGIGPSLHTHGGLITSGPLRGTYFGTIDPATGTAAVGRLVYGEVAGPWMRGGDYELTREGHVGSNSLASDEERQTLFGRVSWSLAPDVTIFGQISLSEFEGLSYYQQTPNTGNVVIRTDNAYLPASVREQLIALNQTQFSMGTTNNGIPAAGSNNTRKVGRYVLGAEGGFGMLDRSWDWDAYYQKGKADTDELLVNTWNNERMALAQDAVIHPDTGSIVCRSAIANPGNGCIPINRMGFGGVTAEAVEYIMGPSQPYRAQTLEQSVAAINLSTDELFSLWAGPVSFATGLEWREEQVSGSVDPVHEAGWLYGNYKVTEGSYNVVEGYLESIVPLASNLDLNGAYRWTDYELSGQVETWKVGLSWQPLEDVRVRVTQSRDIRAPNLAELFAAGTARTNTVNLFPSNQAAQFVENTSGNLGLTPEEADSLGVGFVVNPRFLPDLRVSVDYYKISMENNIGTVSAQNTANLCLEQGVQTFCRNMIYNEAGILQGINLQPVNFSSLEAKGVDFEATYLMSIGSGDLTLRGMLTRYIDSTSNNGINIPSNDAGTQSLPGWTYRLSAGYAAGPVNVNLIARGFSDTVYNTLWIECTSDCPASGADIKTINDNDIPGAYYLDASLAYELPVSRGEAEVFLYVNNLLNTDPEPVGNGPTGNNTPAYPQTNRGQFDTFGRALRMGIRMSF